MPQRTSFTTISPLPPSIRRAQAVAFLQDHLNMIDLNPLVKRRKPIDPPSHCPPDERHCTWYAITDSISYLPGGLYDGEVNYTAAFNDLPGQGMQSHSYAAMGVEIQGKWTVGGNEPGEKPEPRELGSEAPREGLYLREECEVKCNMIMTRFIKKTILKSHGKLMSSLIEKAASYPVGNNDNSRGRRERPSNVHPGRHGSGAGRSASPSLPSPTEPSPQHSRAASEAWIAASASTRRLQQSGGGRRPYATSSDAYLSQQQQRYAQNTAHPTYGGLKRGASSENFQDASSRRNMPQVPQPERPYPSSDVYLAQQQRQQEQMLRDASDVPVSQSTPGGLHLYSNSPHHGGALNGVTQNGLSQGYSQGTTRQNEFAELP
ncbi:hypothetical protein LIA77_07626 [Sarocladium implicatum]|nr:hypothetical protein LIA77_07626 [Sarocladium implicatum]